MDQAVIFNFAIVKNQRVYQFLVQPGAPWEEVYEALAEFDKEIRAEQAKSIAAEEAKKASAQEKPLEPEIVEPETPVSE